MSQVVVAGHICLDIFPEMQSSTELRPGQLIEVDAARFSPGGCVSNVGLALHKLGVDVQLAGKICSDPFGKILQDQISEIAPDLEAELIVVSEGNTSYTVVISPSGQDRIFLHSPGCNNTFGKSDLDFEGYGKAKVFHLGYPPLMARMFADEGKELADIFFTAKQRGHLTSLDLSLPDPNSEAGRAPWRSVLANVLPFVDYFLPTFEELVFIYKSDDIDVLLDNCTDAGAGTTVVKKGEDGLFTQSGNQILNEPCYEANVVGTTGAGDATIAGFLLGVVSGWPVEGCLRAATAVGACSVESADATSGIRSWQEIEKRINSGWSKR